MTTQTLMVAYYTVQSGTGSCPFNTTKTVSGTTYVGVSTTDGNGNYYYFYPALESIDSTQARDTIDTTSLSGGTWQTVNTVDYIQSPGTSAYAYINTGVYPTGEFEFEGKITFNSASVRNIITGSFKTLDNYPTFSIELDTSSKVRAFIKYSSSAIDISSSSSVTTSNAIYKSVKSSGNSFTVYVNDVQKLTTSVSSTYSFADYSIYLFQDARGNAVFGAQKLYYAKYTNDGTLVRDYIPIYYNGIYALYDKCLSGEVIYDNDGAGTFTGDSSTAEPLTYTHTVQGSPSVKVFNATSNTWVDGTPYVFNGTSWVEADAVYVYVNGSWVEKT